MPAYNYARFLPDAIASLQAQTCTDWECIVADDGSTDDTAEIVAGLMRDDVRIRYVRGEHMGVSAARNAGLALGSAGYVQFLDADDRLEPDKLRAHADYLERHPDVGIVHGDAGTFDARFDPRDITPVALVAPVGHGSPVVAQLVVRNTLIVSAPLARRRVVDEVGGFAEDLLALEDWDLWMRCAVAGAVFARHAPSDARALVRMHPTSSSREAERMLAATIDLRRRFDRLPLPTSVRARNARHLARAEVRSGLMDLRRGHLRRSSLGLLRALRRLLASYR
jgi:glycosyltransferase involved in cell wall biosynthesis